MQSIEAPINGMNLYAPRHCRTTVNHGQTPLEAEWMIEVLTGQHRVRLRFPCPVFGRENATATGDVQVEAIDAERKW